jgi:hypothetical protein
MRTAEFSDPKIVSVEAGFLVIGVGVVAQHHSDARVDDLRVDAIAVLVCHSRLRIPTAALQIGEFHGRRGTRQLLGRLARRGHEANRNGILHSGDLKNIATLFVMNNARSVGLIFLVDTRQICIRRFHDMRVGGNDRFRYDLLRHNPLLLRVLNPVA